MPTKEEITVLRQQGLTFIEIAKNFGVTRQRIHQKFHNYKNFGYRGRYKLYEKCWKDNCEICNINPTHGLHHKDNNNLNDTPSNLISVCIKCHGQLHQKYKNCLKCKVLLKKGYLNRRLGLCKSCYNEKKRGYKKGTWSNHSNFCVSCKRDNIKHYGKDMCRTCYRKKELKKKVSYFKK